jgi:hypothetical protein
LSEGRIALPSPLVRARHLKLVLAAVDRQPSRQAIRDRMGPTLVSTIEEATGFDWLPVAHDVAMARSLDEVLGPAGLATFNREMMLQSFRGPLLVVLAEIATRFLGLDAGAWASWVPKGWALMFQGCGRWTVVRHGEGEATLTVVDLPPECVSDAVWPRSVASSLSGIIPAVGAEGTVELERIDPRLGTAVYTMRWKAGRPAGTGM